MIYLDYTATTPLNEEVRKAYVKLLETKFANPDSLHNLGLDTETLMNKSRTMIAEMLHVKFDEVIFTSGASESNNTAIKGVAFSYSNRGKHIITTTCEHSSVYETCRELEKYFGYEITYINVDTNGNLDLKQLEESIRKDTILISCMLVNNEIGFINPIDSIYELIQRKNPLCKFHVDMVQALGKIPVSLEKVDLASFSAHKIYGLKGSGLLIKKDNCKIVPLIAGGQQEFHLRAGTSNVLTNIVFAKTLRLAIDRLDEKRKYVMELNSYLRDKLAKFNQDVNCIHINSPIDGSPYILNVSFIGYKPEVFVHELEKYEIYLSTRSACSTKELAVSRILDVMGFETPIAASAVRISLSALTTKEEIDKLMESIEKTVKILKKQR